jgi:glycine/D-amino acid oxidase-like deaminating enzyme
MIWPPAESFWSKLYAELPDGADRAEFQKAIKTAVMIYQCDHADHADPVVPWNRLHRVLNRAIEEFERVLEETDTAEEQLPRSYALNDLRVSHQHAAHQLRFEEALAQKRTEQLYANLVIACTKTGGVRLSDRGPLVRALKAIIDQILPNAGHGGHGLSDRGVREIIRRHIERDGAKPALD